MSGKETLLKHSAKNADDNWNKKMKNQVEWFEEEFKKNSHLNGKNILQANIRIYNLSNVKGLQDFFFLLN